MSILKEEIPHGMSFRQDGKPQNFHVAVRVGLTGSNVSTDGWAEVVLSLGHIVHLTSHHSISSSGVQKGCRLHSIIVHNFVETSCDVICQ
jgi:hypothetical protein